MFVRELTADEERADKCVRELKDLTHDEHKRAGQHYKDAVGAACLDGDLLSFGKEFNLHTILEASKDSKDPERKRIGGIIDNKALKYKKTKKDGSILLFVVQDMLLSLEKAPEVEADYQALLAFLKDAWGSDDESIAQIEITREKLNAIKLLADSLKDKWGESVKTNDQKIMSYSERLKEGRTMQILSQHRDAISKNIENNPFLFSVLAVLSGIGVVYFLYKAVDSYCKYGSVSFFNAGSKNMMNEAKQHIGEYNEPAGSVSPK